MIHTETWFFHPKPDCQWGISRSYASIWLWLHEYIWNIHQFANIYSGYELPWECVDRGCYLKSKKSRAVMVSRTANCSTSSLKMVVILWILLTTFSMFLSSRTCGQSPHLTQGRGGCTDTTEEPKEPFPLERTFCGMKTFPCMFKVLQTQAFIFKSLRSNQLSFHVVSLTHMFFNEQVPNWIKLPQYLLKPQLIS